jgi:hypothetical protein
MRSGMVAAECKLMNYESVIRFIGLLHLLQPPFTMLLASRLRLRASFQRLPPVAYGVAQNMAVAAVALPTTLGVYLAVSASDVVRGGAPWLLAVCVALFWTWRLERQLRIIGPLLGEARRTWHPFMSCVFFVQGPVLALVLLSLRVGGAQ